MPTTKTQPEAQPIVFTVDLDRLRHLEKIAVTRKGAAQATRDRVDELKSELADVQTQARLLADRVAKTRAHEGESQLPALRKRLSKIEAALADAQADADEAGAAAAQAVRLADAARRHAKDQGAMDGMARGLSGFNQPGSNTFADQMKGAQ